MCDDEKKFLDELKGLIRKSAGGFHAKTHLGCCCILAVVLSLFIVFIKFVPTNTYVALTVIAVVFSVSVILLFAPLEHENKPISDKDRRRLRKISVIYTILVPFIIFLLFIANMKEIMICIALGMFTASSSMLVAAIEKNIKSIHLGT